MAENAAPKELTGQQADSFAFDAYKRKLLREVLAMAEFAHEQCRPISEQAEWMLNDLEKGLSKGSEGVSVQLLTALHRDLCNSIAPAKPKSVLYLKEQKEKAWSLFKWISPIGNIRYMIMASFISLAAFVGISVMDVINKKNLTSSFVELNFWDQLVVALFLLSAAGIGATYANLYKAYTHIPKGTYDPDYNATYWVRFALGLTSGYILAELLTLDMGQLAATASEVTADASDAAVAAVAASSSPSGPPKTVAMGVMVSKPVLALLGGFSASAVFRILTRLVEAVEAIVQGDAKTRIELKEAENMAKLQVAEVQRKSEHIQQLVGMKASLQAANASADLVKIVDDLIQKTTRTAPAEPPLADG
ncbi:hypothetical protein V5T82_17010 [Magnetovibrio sp. PR-2]|uniref:hypothetical protein n=1 Tax=Magnetovibrio sp. PR-2 TaxID=3120356 RepID=UPI002FCE4331